MISACYLYYAITMSLISQFRGQKSSTPTLPTRPTSSKLIKKDRRVAMAQPIFHCPKCLQYWLAFGITRRYCRQPDNPVHGPEMPAIEIPACLKFRPAGSQTPPSSPESDYTIHGTQSEHSRSRSVSRSRKSLKKRRYAKIHFHVFC